MSTAYNVLSDDIQIAAATGNNERLLELEAIVDGAFAADELTDLEFNELMDDINGSLV